MWGQVFHRDKLGAIKEETGKGLDEIKKSKGIEKNVLMDFLYRAGGIKGTEIGRLLEVDYSTVSQWRKRLRDRLKKDKKLKQLDRGETVTMKDLTP